MAGLVSLFKDAAGKLFSKKGALVVGGAAAAGTFVGENNLRTMAENTGNALGTVAGTGATALKVSTIAATLGAFSIPKEAVDALMKTVGDMAKLLMQGKLDFNNLSSEFASAYANNKEHEWDSYVDNALKEGRFVRTQDQRDAILNGINKLKEAKGESLEYNESVMIRQALTTGKPAYVLSQLQAVGSSTGNSFIDKFKNNPDYTFSNEAIQVDNAGRQVFESQGANLLYSGARGVLGSVVDVGSVLTGAAVGVGSMFSGGSFAEGYSRQTNRVKEAFNFAMPPGLESMEGVENVASFLLPGTAGFKAFKLTKLGISSLFSGAKNVADDLPKFATRGAATSFDYNQINTSKGWGFGTAA